VGDRGSQAQPHSSGLTRGSADEDVVGLLLRFTINPQCGAPNLPVEIWKINYRSAQGDWGGFHTRFCCPSEDGVSKPNNRFAA
jgi:hypothetical protein